MAYIGVKLIWSKTTGVVSTGLFTTYKNCISGAEEMTQRLSMFTVLSEDPDSGSQYPHGRQLTTICISCSWGSEALFWPP